MTKAFIIQRGRQKSVVELFKKLSIPDYFYDFREWKVLKKISILGLLIKSFLTSLELPKNLNLLICEGSLCTFVGIFYKLRNPNTFLISYIIDPAFWVKNKSFFPVRILFRSFMHRRFVDHTVCITKMVLHDGITHGFIEDSCKASIIPLHSTIKDFGTLVKYKNRSYSITNEISLVYIIDRPIDTSFTKGLDIVIKICDLLSNNNIKFKLNIYGFGTENLDIRRPWLIKHGYSSMLLKAFESSDIFLLPSRYDASSIALIEAISHGLIPIVSNKVGSSEFLEHRYSSKINLVNSIEDTESWVFTILEILKSSNTVRDEIVSDLRINIEHINLDNIVESFNKLISNSSKKD